MIRWRYKVIVAIIAWLTCGILAAGFMNANRRAEFSRSLREATINRNTALAAGILGGPLMLMSATIVSGLFYDGWTLRGDAVCAPPPPDTRCKP